MAYNFLRFQKDFEINGTPIHYAILEDADSLEDYAEKIVMVMGTEAYSLVLYIVPLILRMSVHTVLLDMKEGVTTT